MMIKLDGEKRGKGRQNKNLNANCAVKHNADRFGNK